jgi:hypothetical protein
MKLITILTSIAGLSLAVFLLGLTFDHFELPLFAFALAAWFTLLTVHAYLPARRQFQPRRAAVLAARRNANTLPWAA